MRLAVMQPYVFPYIGYFQLIQAADRFVFYDDVNFIKRGWIHRNNLLVNGSHFLFSIPLAQVSQHKLINETELHPDTYDAWRQKFAKTITQSYKTAPYFRAVYPLIMNVLDQTYDSVAALAEESLRSVASYLNIATSLVRSSSLSYPRASKGQERILAICRQQQASVYINLMGGAALYEHELFAGEGIDLKFIQAEEIIYAQFKQPFVSNLSIIDVLMFNSQEEISHMLQQYRLVTL